MSLPNIEPARLVEQAAEYARRRSPARIEGRVYDRDEIMALGDDWFLIGQLECAGEPDAFYLLWPVIFNLARQRLKVRVPR